MTVTTSAGPWANFAPMDSGSGLGNVRPLDRRTAASIGEWIEMLARISHDLRTPLNAVIGFSEAMQHELFGPLGHARYQEYARDIHSSGALLLRAAEDTLSVTALLAAPRQTAHSDVRLDTVLDATVAELASTFAAAGIGLGLPVQPAADVRSDPELLPRAVRQLLTATLGIAAQGAAVAISTVRDHDKVVLHVTLSEAADYGLVSCMASGKRPAAERGLGREQLATGLARMMLEALGCQLTVELWEGGLRLTTAFERSTQNDLFGAID